MTADDRPICRLCGQPIEKGEPRYREEEGDVHSDCYKRQRRPPKTE
jgi:hypothetical protein